MSLGTFLRDRPTTRLRGLMWLSFNDLATIQAPTITSDIGGGGTTVWNTIATAACRVYPVTMRGKGALVGGQINEHSTHFCQMPPETNVNTSDRILLASGGTFSVTLALETTDELTTRVEVMQVS